MHCNRKTYNITGKLVSEKYVLMLLCPKNPLSVLMLLCLKKLFLCLTPSYSVLKNRYSVLDDGERYTAYLLIHVERIDICHAADIVDNSH